MGVVYQHIDHAMKVAIPQNTLLKLLMLLETTFFLERCLIWSPKYEPQLVISLALVVNAHGVGHAMKVVSPQKNMNLNPLYILRH